MNIAEPMTMFTDYLISAQCFYLFINLKKQLGDRIYLSQRVWMFAIVAIGLASFFGGTHHGLALILPENFTYALWRCSTYAVGVVSFLILVGTMKSSLPGKWHKPLFLLSLLQLLVFFYWMIDHDKFLYVIMDYALSMIAVLVFQTISKLIYKTGSEGYFIKAVIISLIGAGVQQSDLDLHHHFNHNDIYHLIQMVSIYMFYKGVPLLKDQA
jgi:hypothetical protein